MSTPPWLDARFSIGNLVTIAMMLVGLVAGWFQFANRVSLVEADLRRTAAIVDRMEMERGDLSARVIRIEERLAGQAEILQRILRNTETDRRH
jgi:hypothetical protein